MSAGAPSVEALLNVSVDSLAKHVGVVDDGQGEVPDSTRNKLLKMQVSNTAAGYNVKTRE